MIQLLDEPFAIVSYEAEFSEIKLIWKNVTMTFDDYKKVFNTALEAQQQYKPVHFLSDVREQKILPPHFRKWFQEVAIPKAREQGLQRAAVVFSGNVFKKYYLNNIFNTTKTFGIELKFFNEVEPAEKWFKSFL